VISDSSAVDPELRREASRRGLAAIEILRFPSMVMLRDRAVLSDVRVVSPGYPLRGELRIAERLFGPDRVAGTIPGPGTVWVDERLLTSLDIGAEDRVGLGNSRSRSWPLSPTSPGWSWDS
jgi:putative ABC transport system permease protein